MEEESKSVQRGHEERNYVGMEKATKGTAGSSLLFNGSIFVRSLKQSKGGIMNIDGMSATGYDTVGNIVSTHMLQYFLQTDGISVVLDLLTNHTPVAPVVDNYGHLAG